MEVTAAEMVDITYSLPITFASKLNSGDFSCVVGKWDDDNIRSTEK